MFPALLFAAVLSLLSLSVDSGAARADSRAAASRAAAPVAADVASAPDAASAADAPVIARPPFPDPAERLRILTGHKTVPPEALRGPSSNASTPSALQAPPPNTENDYDLHYTFLDIDITDTAGHRIQGKVTHRIESQVSSLTQVVLNLVNSLIVDSVRVNGAPSTFTHSSDLVRIDLPTPLGIGGTATVRVAYRGQPVWNGVGLRFDSRNGQPFIWNLSEPDGGKYWWPCKDHPYDKADSADIRITAPDWMTATSNGLLVSHFNVQGNLISTWHCSYPISSYLISVTAGDFARVDEVYPIPGGGTMPIQHYVFPDQVSAATVDFNIAPAAIAAYAERFGPYPFLREKYGISVFGWGGAMEHQTNTSYGWFLINGLHSFDYIYVHELSHQWFGDNITCATYADSWLNEGFASWCEAIWQEDQSGIAAYRTYLNTTLAVSDPSGPVYNFPSPFDGNTIYNKGAWAVHMLRGVLGDDAFFEGLAAYRNLFQGRNASTEDLRAALEASSGRDLSWFFNEWIYGMNRPHYVVSNFSEAIPGGRRVYVHLDQSQTDVGFFTMPVPIRIVAGGNQNFTLWNDPDHDDLVVDVPTTPTSITLDPDSWILKSVTTGAYGLNLVSSDLPPAPAENPVTVPLVARGGTTPYTWALVDPAPSGIDLNTQTGVLSGTPQIPGQYAFRVLVRDSFVPARVDTARLHWTINPSAAETTDGATTALISSALRAIPNPASSNVLIAFQGVPGMSGGDGNSGGWPALLRSSAVEWAAFDLSGREVATARTSSSAGHDVPSWMWDGRDQAGHALPSGLYWIRARVRPESGQERTATGRVFLLR